MGQQQAVQLPLVLDGRDREDESIQKRLQQAQIESNEEYEEELLVSERNERYASLVQQHHHPDTPLYICTAAQKKFNMILMPVFLVLAGVLDLHFVCMLGNRRRWIQRMH